MIRELAEFEKLRAQCRIGEATIRRRLFGRNRPAEALIAWRGRVPVGYAVFFRTFSTFEGKPGIYIEDLFVRAPFRQRGIGQALLQAIGKVARASGAGRIEWTVLTWNRNARRLYARIGAREKPEWLLLRVEGAALRRFPAKNCRG